MLAWFAVTLGLLACSEPTRKPVERVQRALESVRFVAYTPRGFDPEADAGAVSARAIRADLEVLGVHFDGLVTYSSANGLDAVPSVARELGFRAVVLGVWNPTSDHELALAIEAARSEPDIVLALALGNEGLFFDRYDAPALARAFSRARRDLPGVAITTTEPFSSYLDPERAPALPVQDFLLPVAHPLDQPWFGKAEPETAIDFVVNVVRELEAKTGLPVLLKETGVPSGPREQGFSEAGQAAFWSGLEAKLPATRAHAITRFEAFDAGWKIESVRAQTGDLRPTEAHWGFFREDGSAKPVVAAIAGAVAK